MGKQSRDRARALREAQAIRAQPSRRLRRTYLVGGALIAALIASIGIAMANATATQPDDAVTGAVVRPAVATAAGALAVGDAKAPVRLEVFVDYMCPFCGRFEVANGAELARLVRDKTVRLELHPLAFLDETSRGAEYSTRTANAVATVADRTPERLLAFHQALFDRQPREGTAGLTDGEIATLAREAGVPAEVVGQFGNRRFVPWVAQSTQAAFAGGITGTPTVRIDGAPFTGDLYSVGPLTQAITAAATGAS